MYLLYTKRGKLFERRIFYQFTKVNILFINIDASMHVEFNEFAHDIDVIDHYSNSLEKSIAMLHEHQIDIVVLKIGKLSDASILKHIHDYYKNIKVLVSARKDFEEALTIFNQAHFEKVSSPMGLADLKGHLTH